MLKVLLIVLSVLVFALCIDGQGFGSWTGESDQELEDEKQDAAIYRAVVSSMNQYNARRNTRPSHRRKRSETSVCYDEVGCFSSAGPFDYLDALPSPPNEIKTNFLLYPPGSRTSRSTSDVPSGETFLEFPASRNMSRAFSWASTRFDKNRLTVVLVHGFGSSCKHVWVYEMRSALSAVADCNLVCVDWEGGATLPNYVRAAANTRLVGKQLAELLRGLEKNTGLSREKMHLIGFSLGAHVAGFAGAEMKNISRITGLDPAGPLFELQDPLVRLDSTDADFVDVIHSNGENLILGGLGAWSPMGHVDFYPNGGRMQKGCSNLFVGAVTDIIWSSNLEGRSLCNHRRAYKFFTDSISPRCHFPAFPCDSYEDFLEGKCFPCAGKRKCGNMGYYADKSIGRGQLFLITRDEEPFCAHQYNVKIFSTPTDKQIVNYGKIKITMVGDVGINETFTLTKKDDEELHPGEIVSKILVPHPIIYEPVKIELLYQGYSGWLSSGLRTWKIDKISIMDSFGKMASVCKRNFELESGVAVSLKLYPGDCHSPHENSSEENTYSEVFSNFGNHSSSINSTRFIPTTVVRIGDEVVPSKNLEDNLISARWKPVDSKRSLNVKEVDGNKEVVEPVLKKSSKNARSHDLDSTEISEPILKAKEVVKKDTNGPDITTSGDPWKHSRDTKPVKRHDASPPASETSDQGPIRSIIMTVQFLPERLSKMFEQAERYARETIFPLITQHTPRLLTTLIGRAPAYLPLGGSPTEPNITLPKASPKKDFSPPDVAVGLSRTDSETPSNTTAVNATVGARSMDKEEVTTTQKTPVTQNLPPITVNLPVFDPEDVGVKYIPLSYPETLKSEDIT